MKVINTSVKPELVVFQTGESLKVLQVTGKGEMVMPMHHSTSEAVIVVLAGSAILEMEDKKYLLQEGNSLVIPARHKHTLSLKADFKARVIMPLDSRIEFAD